MIRICQIAIAALALLSVGCTQDSLGPEYREISEEESGLQFYAPGLEGGYRKILYGQDEQFVKHTAAVYGPKRGEYPYGQIILIEMPPGRHFTRVDPPQDSIKEWGPFENRTITLGPTGSAVNAIGRIDYATFQADGAACVIFRQVFGTAYDAGYGTYLLDGYYCKGEAPMMTDSEAVSVTGVVGHRKFGPIEAPAGWDARANAKTEPGTMPILVRWEANGRQFPGRLTFTGGKTRDEPPSIWGEIQVHDGPHGGCDGKFTLTAAGSKMAGDWSLDCADGATAKGTLFLKKSKLPITGSGEDSDAHSITFVYDG